MPFSSLGNLVQKGINITSSINPGGVLSKLPSTDQVTGQALLVARWIKHPEVVKYILAPGATFSTVSFGLANLGFNSAGIGAGTAAAAIQSSVYGGAVPAGGYFATMQSMGMLGTLFPAGMGVAAGLAGSVALAGWATGGNA